MITLIRSSQSPYSCRRYDSTHIQIYQQIVFKLWRILCEWATVSPKLNPKLNKSESADFKPTMRIFIIEKLEMRTYWFKLSYQLVQDFSHSAPK